jgi:hypothetical protein
MNLKDRTLDAGAKDYLAPVLLEQLTKELF